MDARYRPGVCNIGPHEIARRRRGGYALFAVTIVLGLVLVALGAPPVARALVALPLAAGFATWLQARRRFCAGFAFAGIRNLGGPLDREQVEREEDRRADRAAALRLVRDGVLLAVLPTAVLVLLPT
jgi:hypothetical protein